MSGINSRSIPAAHFPAQSIARLPVADVRMQDNFAFEDSELFAELLNQHVGSLNARLLQRIGRWSFQLAPTDKDAIHNRRQAVLIGGNVGAEFAIVYGGSSHWKIPFSSMPNSITHLRKSQRPEISNLDYDSLKR